MITQGTVVRHSEFGVGRVTFALEGFPKVKASFAEVEQKVAVTELLVESPAAVNVRVSVGRGHQRARPPLTAGRTGPRQVAAAQPLLSTARLPERLANVIDVWRRELDGLPARAGWRMRLHYDDAEVELAYMVARSPENKADLADLLGRSEHAIDYLWRWCDMAQFPERAGNEIERQVAAVRARLGDEARGSWPVVPDDVMALAISSAA
ncbi:MAG: hypothetical protein KIT58_03795 [Planctomycetota bacterium]|nr:hypothetical protein [Planctomycetota bacterium]